MNRKDMYTGPGSSPQRMSYCEVVPCLIEAPFAAVSTTLTVTFPAPATHGSSVTRAA